MTQIHWLDPVSGYFQTAADWAGGVVPGAANDAILDAAGSPYTVTVTNSGTVNGVDLAANAELLIGASFTATHGTDGGVNDGSIVVATDGRFVVGGTLTNTGSIQIDGLHTLAASGTEIIRGSMTLEGGGTISLTGRSAIEASGANGVLINVDNTIAGAGLVGNSPHLKSKLAVVNDALGIIDADVSHQSLNLDYDGSSTNFGLVEATGGGNLFISVTNIDNTGGVIEAQSGGVVAIDEAMITGGQLIAGTNSTVEVENLATVSGAALSIAAGGYLVVIAGSTVVAEGAITNAGTFTLKGDPSPEVALDLFLTNNASLAGSGVVELKGSAIVGSSVGVVLTNVDNAIIGNGYIGDGSLTFVNQAAGVVEANVLELTVDTGTKTIVNAGLMESVGVDADLIVASPIDNTGTISTDGGTVTVQGRVSGAGSAVINGGTIAFTLGFNQKVAFTGSSGVLDLAKSLLFHQAITGFSATGGTSLDLGDIAFVSAGEATYSGTKARGVLTVTDGAHTAAIHLTGDYLGATFTASSDGHDGTSIVASTPGAAAPQAFVAAAAGLGGRAGEPVHSADAGLTRTPALSTPHAMTA